MSLRQTTTDCSRHVRKARVCEIAFPHFVPSIHDRAHFATSTASPDLRDLALAAQIQSNFLPAQGLALDDWETQYWYQPAGPVGGDYCELIVVDGGTIFFAVGDVSGKGVAASLLMAHISAIFRCLLPLQLTPADLVSRANRLFWERTAPDQYMTLVCGFAMPDGIELVNAGHCRPLLLRNGITAQLDATGLPLGILPATEYGIQRLRLKAGEKLVLYSDGLTEAQNPAGEEYQVRRLIESVQEHSDEPIESLTGSIRCDVAKFRKSRGTVDDATLLILRRRERVSNSERLQLPAQNAGRTPDRAK